MDMDKIGIFIKEQRIKLGLSQNDLGDKLYVTRQAVSSWENGKCIPDSDLLLKLSELFSVSVNDILCGETLEESLLDLVDENNRKTSKIKRLLFLSLSTLLLSIILLLTLYFINNYNSIKVYTVKGKSTHFRILDGIVISTSKNTYFKLGFLEKKQSDIKINNIKIYYLKDDKEELLYEGDTNDRLFTDDKGYDELYRYKFNKYKNNLYIEVTYNDTEKEKLKLKVKEDFKNNYILSIDKNSVIKNDIEIAKTDKDIKDNIQDKNEYNENKKELIKPQEEIKKIPEKEVVQEEQKTINYEEIVEILKGKYDTDSSINSIEYQLGDGLSVVIGLYRSNIVIDTHKDSIDEKYLIKIGDDVKINYTKTENYEIVDRISGTEEELQTNNSLIINNIYNYLMLLYNE